MDSELWHCHKIGDEERGRAREAMGGGREGICKGELAAGDGDRRQLRDGVRREVLRIELRMKERVITSYS